MTILVAVVLLLALQQSTGAFARPDYAVEYLSSTTNHLPIKISFHATFLG